MLVVGEVRFTFKRRGFNPKGGHEMGQFRWLTVQELNGIGIEVYKTGIGSTQ